MNSSENTQNICKKSYKTKQCFRVDSFIRDNQLITNYLLDYLLDNLEVTKPFINGSAWG